PKGTRAIHVALIEYDHPRTRRFTLKDSAGRTLLEEDVSDGFTKKQIKFEHPNQYDDQLLTFETSAGPGDFMVAICLQRDEGPVKSVRGNPAVAAVLAPDEATAKAIQGGAIYHDGQVFWQMFQVRYHDWLKRLKPEDFAMSDAAGKPIEPAK